MTVITLAASFVAATDEVWRLQNDDDPECRFFRKMVRGKEDPVGGSLQGFYVCTPSGVRLGGMNTHHAGHVAEMLERALTRYDELPVAERKLPKDAAIRSTHRWENSHPDDGLTLVSTCRDLPDADAKPDSDRFNRDHVWFTKAEARRFLPPKHAVGAAHDLPRTIVERFTRFHLVDNVKGQTIPYAPAEVETSRMRAEITARDRARVTLRISGTTRAAADEWQLGDNYWRPNRVWPRGIVTRLRGRAVYDLETGAFTSFDLVALGARWGRSIFNGRGNLEPTPIGFCFTIAPEGAAHRKIAPTFVNVYNAEWIRHPGD